MTTHVTIRSGDRDYPALVVDAIGGEPATVMSGDAHVTILTWHGIAAPHTVGTALALYLTVSHAYLLAEALGEAADRVVGKLIDRREGRQEC